MICKQHYNKLFIDHLISALTILITVKVFTDLDNKVFLDCFHITY
jgi:hypothetical protein